MCAKHIGFLIKPASSACNMRYRYCFYCDVAAHREERRDRQQVSWALQTNGYLIDGEWAEFFREHGFLIGVSVDAYRDLHDSMRPDAHGTATYARVMGGVRLLRETGVDVYVLSVLTSQMAAHPQRVFSFIKREGITHIQFIPCLPGLDDEHDAFSLAPREFSSFYCRLFDLWWRELGAGNYVSIWLFENIMQMALGQFPSQCGMLGRCAPQFVVESDGSVYPCDFYALDEHRVGDIRNDDLEAMATCEAMHAFLREPRRACSQCADCPFEGMCHRNCKRLNIAYYDEGYCGLREFLEYAYPGLQRVARMFARR